MVVYNVHNLTHLADDALRHGSLKHISAFPFKNFMRSLLKHIKKPSQPLEPVIRRCAESAQLFGFIGKSVSPLLSGYHEDGPLPAYLIGCSQYTKICLKKFQIGISPKDNCVLLNEKVILVRNILQAGDIFLVYQSFTQKSDFFHYPTKSSLYKVYDVAIWILLFVLHH